MQIVHGGRRTVNGELLRTFIAIHQAGSISEASGVLHRSQPAVSRRIAQLEDQVGAPLFDRIPDGMRLSAAGRELLPFAHAALAAMEDGRRAVLALHDEDRGPVTVAIVGTLAGTWLTGALRTFAKRHASVDVRLVTANSQEITELVRSGDATFGVSYARVSDPVLSSRMLFDERLVLACGADHPRAGRRAVALDELRDERWLAFPDRWPRLETSARHIHGLLAAAGVPEDAIQTVDSLTAQKRLIEAGFGISLLPASSIVEEVASGTLTTITLDQSGLSTPVTLTLRKHSYLSHATRTLLDALTSAPRAGSSAQ